MAIPKKKWTGRRYGHEQVVDQEVLNSSSILRYSTTSLGGYSAALLIAIMSIVIILGADTFLQAKRSAILHMVKTSLAQHELKMMADKKQHLAYILKDISDSMGAQALISQDLAVYPKAIGFFSENSFYLPNKRGVIYINSTSLLGRVAPSMAKRLQVAIILEEGKKLRISDFAAAFGIDVVRNESFIKSHLHYIEIDIPIQYWPWFSRHLNKALL